MVSPVIDRRSAARLFSFLAVAVWLTPQPTAEVPGCGGELLDGHCGFAPSGDACSGDPGSGLFDADCFSCSSMEQPVPQEACRPADEPCEIYEGIRRMGRMLETRKFDGEAFLSVVLAYWDGARWAVPDRWGARAFDGFVVYAMVRTALRFHRELEANPTARRAMECVLRDHAGRGIPTEVDNDQRWFHGGVAAWNSWSEDYMGFALGYAAADAWFASPWSGGTEPNDYSDMVDRAVTLAFSISHDRPQTLRFEEDVDPLDSEPTSHVMLRNHGEYSPVYAMALLKHLGDINDVYRAASLPDRYTCYDKPETVEALYRWVARKIGPNPTGPGYVFRTNACLRRDGVVSYCDDRPDDPPGSYGAQREPGHYPLERVLPTLCITDHLEFFDPECDWVGPAGLVQAEHNYYFNCVYAQGDRPIKSVGPVPSHHDVGRG